MKSRAYSVVLLVGLLVAILTAAEDARAWDGAELWYQSAAGGPNGVPGPGVVRAARAP